MLLRILSLTLALLLTSLADSRADEPIIIAQGQAAAKPQQPQMILSDDGVVHLVYGAEGRAYYCAILIGENKKMEAKALPKAGVMSLGMRRGPRIALNKSGVCITLIAGEKGKGNDGDILAFSMAKDGPEIWGKPIQVNDVAGSAREGLHAMATSPDGRIACAWLDLRNKKSEVMMSLSTDGGAFWSKNSLVYKSPDGAVCPCCHPSVAFGPSGEINIMWRNALGGARDMYLATSSDEGKTFSKAKKLGQGTWKLDACPMDGGMFCVDAKGELSSIWRRENQLFLCEAEGEERGLGIGEQPWIASTSKGPAAVWITKRGGQLNLLKPGETALVTLDKSAADPVIAASPDGKSCAVAWERREGDKTTILVQHLSLR